MTREEAFEILIIKANKGDFVGSILNQIYDDFEAELKAKDEAISELEELIKPKTCEGCDNNHKDRTIFYDGKKALMCTFCKYGAVSYFKPKATT